MQTVVAGDVQVRNNGRRLKRQRVGRRTRTRYYTRLIHYVYYVDGE